MNLAEFKIDTETPGSYCGNLPTSHVPEPETYVMWLFGFGLIGLSAWHGK